MKTSTANALIIMGLILTMFGMGGVEHSTDNADMISATLVSIVGLMTMWAGTSALKVSDYYDTH
jgi:hypothetical protein